MMRKIASVLTGVLLVLFANTGTAEARTKKIHKSTRRTNAPRGRKVRSSKRVHHASYLAPVPHAQPRSQQGPTADRYQEIQQALASKGYYKGDANGQWTAESTDALRRFQTDQNLRVDGKIGSLSLIALGLGPKRSLSAQSQPAPAAPNEATVPPPGAQE